MKKFIYCLIGAIGGLVFCLGWLKLAEAMRLTAAFPAFAGEADFELRAQMLVFGLLPTAAVFGAWVGSSFRRSFRQSWPLVAGAAAGAVVHLALWHSMLATLQALASRSAANTALVIYEASWIVLVALAALGAQRVGSRAKPR